MQTTNMLKNQSIKSFFSSNANKQNKPAATVTVDDEEKPASEKKNSAVAAAKTESKETKKTSAPGTPKDESKSKSSSKASTAAVATAKAKKGKEKEEVEETVIDSSSDFDDSPIKGRNVSMNESMTRKRKLILESDDSDPDASHEAAKKTQKKSTTPSPKKSSSTTTVTATAAVAKKTVDKENKENEATAAATAKKTTGDSESKPLRLSSSEDEAEAEAAVVLDDGDDDVVVEKQTAKSKRGRKKKDAETETKETTKKKEAGTPKAAAKKPQKQQSPKSASKKEVAAKKERSVSPAAVKKEKIASPSTAKSEKKSPTAKRDSSPEPIEDVELSVKKEASPEKPKEAKISNFFSKSTSVFANGKKVQPGEASSKSTDSAAKAGVYAPNKENYHPIKDATWEKGQPVPYQALAQTLYCMEGTTKRLELLSIVSNYFRSLIALSPKDMVPSIFMLTNKVAPDYESIELGIGDTVLFKALAEATGCTMAKLKSEFQSKGDIGLVAEANRCTQKLLFTPKKLTVAVVFQRLKEIASISGNSSQAKKSDLIKNLLVSCDAIEARYLMRSLAGKLRNGLGEQSILTGLGHAFATTRVEGDDVVVDRFEKMRKHQQIDEIKKALEEPVQKVKQAYYQCPNYDVLIDSLVKHGLDEIEEHCKIVPGIPLKPMLAYPTKGIHEVLKRFDNVELTCEYKYDGERAQIHILDNGSVKIYSRNSENNTSKYPDIIEFLGEHLKLASSSSGSSKKDKSKTKEDDDKDEKKADDKDDKDKDEDDDDKEGKVVSAIIDAEVVAYDTEKHIIQPFQKLTTRKRKDAASEDIKVQVCIFAFDLIYLNGKSLIDLSLRKRRDKLYKYFPRVDTKLMYAERIDTTSSETIQEFLDKSIKDGCEGLMIKTLDDDAHYEISKRSHNWLKLKKDYLEGVGDTLDLVVIGGYHGTGKRTGVYGGYLLACYDKENEEYQTICKLGTGLKDNDLQSLFESLSKIKIEKPKAYYRVNKELEQPDVWFEAEAVWEIKCADFSLSPVHTAACGMIDPEKGVSMRFPRFLRVRDDKKAEDATNSEQVVDMYKNQQQMINQLDKGSKSDNEEEIE